MKLSTRVIANTFFQVLGRSLVILASLLTTGILTRIAGSSGYGDYIFVTGFILIFVGLSDLGITQIAVREASQERKEGSKIFSNVLFLRLILSFFLFLILNLSIFLLPQFNNLRLAAFIGSLVLFFLVLRTTAQGVLQTFLRLELASFLEIFASFFFLAGLLLWWWQKKSISLVVLMVMWVGGAFFSGLLGLFFSLQFLSLKIGGEKESTFCLFKEALPLGLYLLTYSIYDRGVDTFFIKTFSDSQAVGYYGLAYKIHSNLILGAAFLMNSLFPIIASFKENVDLLKKTYEKSFTILLLGGIMIFLGGEIFAPLVINLIAGSAFSPSILVLRILLVATALSYLNHLTGYMMIATGWQKKLFSFSLAALAVNLILNLIFIPRFSFLAAAWVTVLTELVIFLLTKDFLLRKIGLKYSFSILKKNLLELKTKKQNYFSKL